MDWFSLDSLNWLMLLAQEAQPQAAPPAQGENVGDNFWVQMVPMVLIAILAYYMLFLPERKKTDHLKKLETIKETDRVITSGGIYGIVTNIQRDAGRATLRVDDATGTKIKVSLAAIAQVLSDDDADGSGNAKD